MVIYTFIIKLFLQIGQITFFISVGIPLGITRLLHISEFIKTIALSITVDTLKPALYHAFAWE